MFYLGEFLFYFGDMVPVRVEKLRFVFFYDMFYLLVHIVDHLIEVLIRLNYWVVIVSRQEGVLIELHLFIIDPQIHQLYNIAKLIHTINWSIDNNAGHQYTSILLLVEIST